MKITELFNRAHSEWLPFSGYDKAQGPDMEVYGISNGGRCCKEIWAPVKTIRNTESKDNRLRQDVLCVALLKRNDALKQLRLKELYEKEVVKWNSGHLI